MNKLIKPLLVATLLNGGFLSPSLEAAPREANGSNKMIAKMQAMVKELTTERDQLKTEKDKLAAEMEQLKKEKTAAASAEEQLNGELAAQKSTNNEVRNKLDQTHAKLLEVIEKYNVLNKAKSELSVNYVNLQSMQKQTETEWQGCEGKNIKMFEAAKEILSHYENRGVMDSLLKAEPILQFKSVEIESIVQEYEDKLTKQKYQHKELAVTKNSKPEPEQAEQ